MRFTAVALCFALCSCVSDTEPRKQRLSVGDIGRIHSSGKYVLLSQTKDGYDQITSAQIAKDDIGLAQLVVAGRAFFAEEGAGVKVIDISFTLRRVRLLDGEAKDKAGWLPFEWVQP